ncbi:prolipoprotein diacylglyceryl transferase [Marinifilum breve]|uniref:Phosphatidylglycerol--prolipoprotein diacylglyceryl transferase n=1 Tax=Marinifilum breve TaxID=2184082 RepID=A0A2V4AAX5_9BACT|nr:prolipoprotein diacylglyceryl transferase [Marinifilum breve]PXY01094.1 prolipoprotein diacylglyceryl transferase [Marinifilum breve]
MILTQINWNPDPEIVNILGLSIRYYSVLFLSGILLSITVLKWIFKEEKLPEANLEKLSMYGVIGILLGARLGHCFFYEPGYYFNHPLEILLPIQFTSNGGFEFTGYRGLASHGGALGLIIALFVYSRKTKHAMLDTIDLIAVVTGLAAGFIRLANLMNSEIVGMPSTKPWAFIFKRIDNIPRHPAQLYEAICYFLILAFMLFLYKTKREQFKNGVFFGTVLFLIFAARFFIEFIKENQVAFESSMQFNMGQLLSIPYIIVGLGFVTYGIRKTRKQLSLQV